MVAGLLVFALVGHFVLRPAMANSELLPTPLVRVLLGVSIGACALSLVLRTRVPQRSTDESADLYWMTANVPALLTWAPLEGASVLAVFVYGVTGSLPAIGIAAVAILLFILLNPAHLEKHIR
jgi:hypothetical protein